MSSSFLLHIFSHDYPKSTICCGHKEVMCMETAKGRDVRREL